MDLYHTWLYEKMLNNTYLIRGIFYFVLAFNFLCPIILWLTFAGRKIKFGFGKQNIQKDGSSPDEPPQRA